MLFSSMAAITIVSGGLVAPARRSLMSYHPFKSFERDFCDIRAIADSDDEEADKKMTFAFVDRSTDSMDIGSYDTRLEFAFYFSSGQGVFRP
jgi:hypothetical protein